MDIPQEIIDEVIDNIGAFDPRTLKSASLVQRSWTRRSRRRLFNSILFSSSSRLERWSLSIPPDPKGIASYPRVIHLSHNTQQSWVEPENLDRFYDHFRSFSGVERLVIVGLEPTKFDRTSTPRYFGNFAATVRSLELQTAIGTPASLLSFICAFPLVDNLAIMSPVVTVGSGNHGEVMRLASMPSFRGRFRLQEMSHGLDCLVELLCDLPLLFHTIWVSSRDTERLPQLFKLVNKCGNTLRSLHIMRETHTVLLGPTGASLTSCVALEELRITTIYPIHLVTTLGEILPTLPRTGNLLQIALDADGCFPEEKGVGRAAWNSLDTIMFEHAEKTSAEHPNRRLVLLLCTNEEGATGERDGWARELDDSLVSFPKVGDVKCVSRY